MPANWFLAEALPVLEAYCTQSLRQRALAAALDKREKAGELDSEYLAMARKEGETVKAIIQLSTKLRLTPQSTVTKNKQKPVVPIRSGGLMAFSERFEQGEIGPDLFRKACEFGLEGLVSKHRDRPAAQRCLFCVRLAILSHLEHKEVLPGQKIVLRDKRVTSLLQFNRRPLGRDAAAKLFGRAKGLRWLERAGMPLRQKLLYPPWDCPFVIAPNGLGGKGSPTATRYYLLEKNCAQMPRAPLIHIKVLDNALRRSLLNEALVASSPAGLAFNGYWIDRYSQHLAVLAMNGKSS